MSNVQFEDVWIDPMSPTLILERTLRVFPQRGRGDSR